MVDLSSVTISPEALRLLSKQTATEFQVLPLSSTDDSVYVAVPEHHDPQLLGDLTFLCRKHVKAEFVPADELAAAIEQWYGVAIVRGQQGPSTEQPCADSREANASAMDSNVDRSVVGLVNRIIADAVRLGASDIHIEPYERSLRVRYRLDGVLHEVLQPELEKAKALISRLKIMADLDIAEKRRPQDGRIRVREAERMIDIRVSTLPTDFGEKIVLRILDKSQLQLDLSKLGFEENDLHKFQRTLRLPYGMILVTGPTGSGKTTTLYAALNSINQPDINITTIEDPIEYNLPGINQTHVRSDIGLTFAAALRSILRQDPNVIMVGEIRDGETAEIAIRAALTGHLVFSTLHTNDAPSAITRLVDMGVEPFLVASSVKMILAQRLLRKLCDQCKSPGSPTPEQMEELQLNSVNSSSQFYKAIGCPVCHRVGYNGRMAVYEVLPVHYRLSSLIARGATGSDLREKSQSGGMLSLREAALRKAARGETSLDEVVRETAS